MIEEKEKSRRRKKEKFPSIYLFTKVKKKVGEQKK